MLPTFQTQDQTLSLLQTKWVSQLNPLLNSPLVNGLFLKNVSLVMGVNVINHKLGATLQGWIITDTQGLAVVYRSAPKNNLTLTLTASGPVTIDIYVF